MAINYDHLMSLKSVGQEFQYGDRETMLYALGIGFGRDPMDTNELPFVYERNLKTVPTMSSVIAWGAGPMMESGINYLMVVHGEKKVTLHKPLPAAAKIVADSRVIGAWDKGADKGAIIVTETVVKEQASGDKLCTMLSSIFARGDGGFGEGRQCPGEQQVTRPDLESRTIAEPIRQIQFLGPTVLCFPGFRGY